MNYQRFLRRERKIAPWRITKLDEIGLIWNPRAPQGCKDKKREKDQEGGAEEDQEGGVEGDDLMWDHMCERLKRFKSVTGHVNVHAFDSEESRELSKWLTSQMLANKRDQLAINKYNLLVAIGVKLDEDPAPDKAASKIGDNVVPGGAGGNDSCPGSSEHPFVALEIKPDEATGAPVISPETIDSQATHGQEMPPLRRQDREQVPTRIPFHTPTFGLPLGVERSPIKAGTTWVYSSFRTILPTILSCSSPSRARRI
jgi:Helicase associated domain